MSVSGRIVVGANKLIRNNFNIYINTLLRWFRQATFSKRLFLLLIKSRSFKRRSRGVVPGKRKMFIPSIIRWIWQKRRDSQSTEDCKKHPYLGTNHSFCKDGQSWEVRRNKKIKENQFLIWSNFRISIRAT